MLWWQTSAQIQAKNNEQSPQVERSSINGIPVLLLGNYPNTSLLLSTDTTVTPDALPTTTTSINVSASTNFKGKLEGDPMSGVVRVTNAHPAGVYTVTVTAFNGGVVSAIKTFTLTVTTPVTCNPVNFAAATNFDGGSNPRSVSIGDFNGDGKQDLVTSAGPSSLKVLIGNGMGSFDPPRNFDVGVTPESVMVGDFNGDGKQDLVTVNANFVSHNVSVLLGNGLGDFFPPTNFVIGFQPRSVVVGDFNDDGKQDLAAASENSNTISVFFGNGTGGFSPGPTIATAPFPYALAIGDFDGDDNQDLVVTIRAPINIVSVFMGNGMGAFGPPRNFGIDNDPLSVTVGDFDGDGDQDLATANQSSDNVSVLLGTGTVTLFSPAVNFPAGDFPQHVAVGDLNGDSKQDLVVANALTNNVSVLLGNGAGSFGAATNFDVGSNPDWIVVGDFNGDGKQDLATSNFFSNNVSILLRICPTPTPTPTPPPPPNVCTPTTTVTEGDLFPGGVVSFGVTSGPGSVTVDHVNAGTGLQSLTVIGTPVNAIVNIPPFTPGTTAPVVVTFTTPTKCLGVDFTLRVASTFHAAFIRVRCAPAPTLSLMEDLPMFPDPGLTSFAVTNGPGSVITIDPVDAGTGLRTLEVLNMTNATVTPLPTPIPMTDTFAPVVVPYTIINPALPVDITLRVRSMYHGVIIRLSCSPQMTPCSQFTGTLSGSQEVPANMSNATGSGTVILNGAETMITVNLSFSGLAAPATMGHIHGPASPGTNAPVLFPFTGVPNATSGSIPQQTFAITPAQVALLRKDLFYFNVHNATFPGGEIRGQLSCFTSTNKPGEFTNSSPDDK